MWDGLLEALTMALEWSVCIQMLSGLLFFFFLRPGLVLSCALHVDVR